jgi:hypothetical protein
MRSCVNETLPIMKEVIGMSKCKDILVKIADWSESKTARAFWLGTAFGLLSAGIEYMYRYGPF